MQKRGNLSIRCLVYSQRLHCLLVAVRFLIWQPKIGGALDSNEAPGYHEIATCIIKHDQLLLIKQPIRIRQVVRRKPRGASVGIQTSLGKCKITSATARNFSYCNFRTRQLRSELIEETNLFTSLIETKLQAENIRMKQID